MEVQVDEVQYDIELHSVLVTIDMCKPDRGSQNIPWGWMHIQVRAYFLRQRFRRGSVGKHECLYHPREGENDIRKSDV